MCLYLVKPEAKRGVTCPKPKDVKANECQKGFDVREYMELHANKTDFPKNAKASNRRPKAP